MRRASAVSALTLGLVVTAAYGLAPGSVAFAAGFTWPQLTVSAHADRSGSVPLNGAQAQNPAYVVLTAGVAARRVAFQLDGVLTRTDYAAPFDLTGSNVDGAAVPAVLTPGAHTVTATVTWVGGGRTLTRAQFVTAPAPTPVTGRPFTAGSAFNLQIPTAPVLDPASSTWAGQLGAPGNAQSALLDETGVAVYEANAATPRYTVRCTESWGPCPLAAQPVPIPIGARAPTGSDGAMVVIDSSTRKSYEFWQARPTGTGGWEASWGSVNSIDGDGYDASGSSPTGAGISRLAGVVRLQELAAGRINHALVFATGISSPGTFRYPASKTDGGNMFGSATPLPEGARVQLDPSINVDAITNITAAEKAVARALQTYGAYNIDNGGYRAMGFSFETASAGEASPYAGAGLAWDYAGMPHIPWNRLQVLRQWDGR